MSPWCLHYIKQGPHLLTDTDKEWGGQQDQGIAVTVGCLIKSMPDMFGDDSYFIWACDALPPGNVTFCFPLFAKVYKNIQKENDV